jgi:hypothetical protein
MYRVPFGRLWVPFPKLGPISRNWGPIEGAEETLTAAPHFPRVGYDRMHRTPFLKLQKESQNCFSCSFPHSGSR